MGKYANNYLFSAKVAVSEDFVFAIHPGLLKAY